MLLFMSGSKLFILVVSVFFSFTTVQRQHIYFQSGLHGSKSLHKNHTSRLPRLELEANLEEFFIKKENNIQNSDKML